MIEDCRDILVIENRKKRTEARDLEFQRLYIQFIKDNLIDGPYPAIQDLRALPTVPPLFTENDSNVVFDSSRFEEHILPIIFEMRDSNRRDIIDTVRQSYARHANQDIGDDATAPTEEILYRAATLFPNPRYRCSPRGTQGPYMTFAEKLQVIWGNRESRINLFTHIESSWIFTDYTSSYEIADPKTAMGVLKMLHLPEDTPYADISGKVICTCGQPSFKQPATFIELVRVVCLCLHFNLNKSLIAGPYRNRVESMPSPACARRK